MTFLSPLWLIGMFPWAAVTLYLLWGRRRQEGVPFLDLWMGPVKGPRPRRRVATPPLALALAILAMLLAVLGAAGPALTAGRGGFTVTLIVDRGSTMSAWGE
ncbi:MAG TPA: BatA domain-containing protein, partial [Tepidisphaeraceae bacterium]|nr:BatA domain-containing protein [Tepidisphaeraceae bacterium]